MREVLPADRRGKHELGQCAVSDAGSTRRSLDPKVGGSIPVAYGHAMFVSLEDRSVVRRIATRFLGLEAGERYAESAGDDLLIRLEPGELRAWDFGDYCRLS